MLCRAHTSLTVLPPSASRSTPIICSTVNRLFFMFRSFFKQNYIFVTSSFQGSGHFGYDGLSRRVSIASNGTTNKYLWCGTEICEQRDSSGGTVTKQFFPQGVRDNSTNYF